MALVTLVPTQNSSHQYDDCVVGAPPFREAKGGIEQSSPGEWLNLSPAVPVNAAQAARPAAYP